MTKLKRCPFCGGEAKTEQCEDITYNAKGKARIYPYTAVYCVDCGARIEEQDEEELADMWNTRTPEIVRCGECRFFEKESKLQLVVAYNFCGRYAVNKKPDDFCSWGERRKENENTK